MCGIMCAFSVDVHCTAESFYINSSHCSHSFHNNGDCEHNMKQKGCLQWKVKGFRDIMEMTFRKIVVFDSILSWNA